MSIRRVRKKEEHDNRQSVSLKEGEKWCSQPL